MSRTCSACRGKKIRCDGALPVCKACTKARKPIGCSYTEITALKATKRDLLQKGAACNACRQKKKKCDAKRPCSTCVASDKEEDCQYRDDRMGGTSSKRMHKSILPESLVPMTDSGHMTHTTLSGSGYTGNLHLQPFLDPVASSTPSSSSMSNFDFSSIFDFDSDMNDAPSNSSHFAYPLIEGVYTSSVSLSISPNIALTETVNSNYLSIPFFIQSPDEKMLLFRTKFLAHRTQIGLCVTQPKLDALQRGDVSGEIINPVLVHLAQLWGCYRCNCSNSEQAVQLQAALNILGDDNNLANDPTTYIQAYSLLALYFISRGDMYRGREYLLKASNVVMKYNLHIAEPATTPTNLEFDYFNSCLSLHAESEAIDERLIALCQLIYLDKSANLLLCFPTLFTGEMDQELLMLPKVNPAICCQSFIVQRARSTAFLQQAKGLSTQWKSGCDASSSSKKYWELMRMIHLHQADVKSAMLQASLSLGRDLYIAFKLCHIKTLTALAYLHDILAPVHAESRKSL